MQEEEEGEEEEEKEEEGTRGNECEFECQGKCAQQRVMVQTLGCLKINLHVQHG
jgi:hypothetical protein